MVRRSPGAGIQKDAFTGNAHLLQQDIHQGRILEKSALNVSNDLNGKSQQPDKHDFFGGEVFAVTAATLRHKLATVASVLDSLTHQIRPWPPCHSMPQRADDGG